jgi:hypothetical protein
MEKAHEQKLPSFPTGHLANLDEDYSDGKCTWPIWIKITPPGMLNFSQVLQNWPLLKLL